MFKQMHDRKGFTLIELMIVVAIIGILAAIAIPNYLGMQKSARERAIVGGAASAKAELQNWMSAMTNLPVGDQRDNAVDWNGNGSLGPAAPAGDIDGAPFATAWLTAMNVGKGERSPWTGGPLYSDAAPSDGSGMIHIECTGRTCTLTGCNNDTADTCDATTHLARETVSVD